MSDQYIAPFITRKAHPWCCASTMLMVSTRPTISTKSTLKRAETFMVAEADWRSLKALKVVGKMYDCEAKCEDVVGALGRLASGEAGEESE